MDAIIFDVDGTLWDSTETVAECWKQAAAEAKAPTAHLTGARLKQEFGKLLPDIGLALFPELPPRDAIAISERACDLENEYLLSHPVPVYDGVREVFEKLSRKLPLFIVSNCQAGYIEVLLETSGLTPYVTAHLCPGDTGLEKAGNIKKIVADYHLTSPCYVGDTSGDEAACREAGVPIIYAAYGFGKVEAPMAQLSAPLDLLRLF